MKALVFACCALCLAGIAGVIVQHHRMQDASAILNRLASEALAQSTNNNAGHSLPGTHDQQEQPPRPPLELLKLRAKVAQLEQQKTELRSIREDNEKLQAQIAARASNPNAGVKLPPGYIHRRDAKWMGLNAPENTVQSFLWALQSKDVTNLLRVLTPESAERFAKEIGASPDHFFEEVSVIPGMALVEQTRTDENSIAARIEFAPGEGGTQPVKFRLVNGEWRMELR